METSTGISPLLYIVGILAGFGFIIYGNSISGSIFTSSSAMLAQGLGYICLVCSSFLAVSDLSIRISRVLANRKAQRLRLQFVEEQKAKGLERFVDRYKHTEKWGTPEQVFEWRQLARGFVKYDGEWVTPEIRDEKEERKRKRKIERERRKQEKERELFEKSQKEKGLVQFVDRLGRERWGTPEKVKEWKVVDMDMKNHFSGLTPRQFERLVGKLFEKMGYVIELTSKTAQITERMLSPRRIRIQLLLKLKDMLLLLKLQTKISNKFLVQCSRMVPTEQYL